MILLQVSVACFSNSLFCGVSCLYAHTFSSIGWH